MGSMNLNPTTVEKFLTNLEVMGHSPNTTRAYKADLFALVAWAGDVEVDRLELEPSAARYLTEGRVRWSPATTKRKVACFRAFGRWAGVRDFLLEYKVPKVAAGIPHPLPGLVDDVLDMYGHAKRTPHQAIVVLCGLLGLRISEARSVHVDDFEEANDGMNLTVRGKGDKTRHIPVSATVMALLDNALLTAQNRTDGLLVPLTDRVARYAWTNLGKRAGVQRPTATHDGRMTFGTMAYVKSDNDIRAVQELLGHASVQTTQGYTGVSEAIRRKAAAVV